MRIADLRTALAAEHHGQPQVQTRIEHALRDLETGLQALAGLGHVYHLEDGPATALPEWPKIMFHVDAAPNGRVVRSQWELADLGPGWMDTLEKAQHADGIATQFAGRGGVKRQGLPMVIEPVSETPEQSRSRARRALDAMVAKFKADNSKESTGGNE